MKRAVHLILLGIFIAGGSSRLVANGGMDTGGGFVYGNTQNPWFLENTDTVHYCVNIDEEHFGVESIAVHDTIRTAIAATLDWVSALEPDYFGGELSPYPTVRLATQRFLSVECSDERVALTFLMGIEPGEGRSPLTSLTRYVAATVREAYDEVNLRGRGYIYVSPQSGPLAPDGSVSPVRWVVADQLILQRVLMHELGHVFGLPHESGKELLTGDRHVEFITSDIFVSELMGYPFFSDYFTSLPFYQPRSFVSTQCNEPWWNPQIARFWGVDEEAECLKLTYDGDSTVRIEVKGDAKSFIPMGEVKASSALSKRDDLIKVRLTSDQRVFDRLPVLEDGSLDMDLAAALKIESYDFYGEYSSVDGKVRRIVIGTITPELGFRLNGLMDGQMVWGVDSQN